MAFNEHLAERIRRALASRHDVEEKKMFGGLCFMVNSKMAVGIVKDELMVRVVESKYAASLAKPHCREMDFTGKPLKGFLYVGAEGLDSERELEDWVRLGTEFADSTPAKPKKSKQK